MKLLLGRLALKVNLHGFYPLLPIWHGFPHSHGKQSFKESFSGPFGECSWSQFFNLKHTFCNYFS